MNSYIAMAAEAWTLRDRMTPSWGIVGLAELKYHPRHASTEF